MNTAVEPTNEDTAHFYAVQQQINPQAFVGRMAAQAAGTVKAASTDDTDPAVQMLDAVSDAIDAPEFIKFGNITVRVGSPSLDDLITLFKALRAESGALEKMAAKADAAEAGDISMEEVNALLKVSPAARTVFLNCLDVEGKTFDNEDDKWQWYSKRLDAVTAIDIMEAFMFRTDWAKLVTKVRRIMGKLQGLAGTVQGAR